MPVITQNIKMNIIPNKLKFFSTNTKNLQIWRSIFVSPVSKLKEIRTIEEDNNIIISATLLESERKPFLLKNFSHACPLCATGLDVKHTDVLILSQFLRSDGCMLPRRITGLCRKQQRRVSSLITMAQKADVEAPIDEKLYNMGEQLGMSTTHILSLMPNLNPANSKRDPQKRYEWKKFNKYFDEATIKFK